jgi:hypothetical protein
MGMAFTVAYCALKPPVGVRKAALGFGVAIWLCLLGTLIIAPHGQEMLFKLTLTTLSLSFLGHLIYGASIGMLLPIFCREEVTRAELWQKKTVPLLQNVLQELDEEEATVKIPRIILEMPIWEKKTATLIG